MLMMMLLQMLHPTGVSAAQSEAARGESALACVRQTAIDTEILRLRYLYPWLSSHANRTRVELRALWTESYARLAHPNYRSR